MNNKTSEGIFNHLSFVSFVKSVSYTHLYLFFFVTPYYDQHLVIVPALLCSFSGMKTPLSPSQLLESGQIFAFGGMCQELVETPTPTTISLSVQQAPSPGDWCVSAPLSCNPCSCLLQSDPFLLFFPQLKVEPTRCVRCVTCSWPPLLRPSCTTTGGLTSAEWDSSRLGRQDYRQQVVTTTAICL